ncbi:hypothetical protein [Nonomuraea sp. LPB2021202275-12-8]
MPDCWLLVERLPGGSEPTDWLSTPLANILFAGVDVMRLSS